MRRALVAASAFLAGCARSEVDAAEGISLVDTAADAGVSIRNVSGDPRRWYIPESNGNGAAWLDYDGDGKLDLFVANGAGMRYLDDGKKLEILPTGGTRLFRNVTTKRDELRFADVTAQAGAGSDAWVNGIASGDVDNDGDVDLYLACLGEDVLLRNDAGRFVDATKAAGLGDPLWGASAAFGDVDNDGDLDLYVANYCEFDPDHPPAGGKRNVINGVEVGWGPEKENPGINVGAPDRFYVNDGKGKFIEATVESGLELAKPLCSYGVVFSDVDADGWQDLLVANDGQPANLFRNLGDGNFREEGVERGFAFAADGNATSAMGLSVEDFDGDGDLDVFRTNFDFEANSLHMNDGHGHFTDRAADFGLAAPSLDKLGWEAGALDVECDGDLDLLVANGHVYPQAERIGMHPWLQKTQLYEAQREAGGRVRFVDSTERAGEGLAPDRSARGVALGDPDDDGDLDALVVDLDRHPRLLVNRSARRGKFLTVKLVGTASNRDGSGARVAVTAGGRTFVREMRTSGGLYSANDPRLHFGLGPVDAVEKVVVAWPSGARQTIASPPLDTLLTIHEAAR